MLAEVLSGRPAAYAPLSSCESAAERGVRTPPDRSVVAMCRPNCYKVLIGVVLVFLLMQFTANFVAYKHKFTVSQSLASNPVSQWSSSASSSSHSSHHINSRLVEPTVRQRLDRHLSNVLPNESVITKTVFVNSSLNNDIKRTLNAISINTGTIFGPNGSNGSAVDPISDFLNQSLTTTTSSLDSCPLIPPKLGMQCIVIDGHHRCDQTWPDMARDGHRVRPKDTLSSKILTNPPGKNRLTPLTSS